MCLWLWYFHIYNCSLKLKKNINLLLQTSVQISDNLKSNNKKGRNGKSTHLGDLKRLPSLCMPNRFWCFPCDQSFPGTVSCNQLPGPRGHFPQNKDGVWGGCLVTRKTDDLAGICVGHMLGLCALVTNNMCGTLWVQKLLRSLRELPWEQGQQLEFAHI